MQIDRERLAHAVYDADDPISGDPIGALIDSDKPDDVCAIRARAWATRRIKYGSRGHR